MVHSDARGEIFVINLPDDQELVLLHSVKGTKRGGHAHDVSEQVMLLIGQMIYNKTKYIEGRDTPFLMNPGDVSFNERNEFHMAEFTKDSWVIEWKLGTKNGSWHNIDYPPWREQVEAAAKGVSE